MLDYHMHIWPHGANPVEPSLQQLSQYAERGVELGIERIAITEHAYRFQQVDDFARGFWETYHDRALAAATERVWLAETGADLDTYCYTIHEAQRSGLDVELGIEIDFIPHHV